MADERFNRADGIILIAVGLLALAAAMLMAYFVTERLPHLEDEIAYLYQARTYARGALWAPPPPNRAAFFTPFMLIVNGRWISKYTVGWPLVLALGERWGAGWLVNPLLGALTVMLTFALGRELFGRQVGVLASLLALSSPFFLIQSSTYMSHAASAFWTTLLLWAWLRIETAREAGHSGRGWAALAGVAVGMLVLTRPLTALAVCLPFAIVLMIRVVRQPKAIPALLASYWPLVLTALPIAALQPVYLYIVTGSPTTNLYTMVWPYDRVGFGSEFGRHGHTLRQGLITAGRDLLLWTSELFGWRYTSWIPLVPGLIFALKIVPARLKHWPLLLGGPFVALVIVHLAYWVGAEVYGPRYYYEGHAGLAILAALGLQAMAELIAKRGRWSSEAIVGGEGFRSVWPAYVLLGTLITLNATTYLPNRLAYWHGLYGIQRAPLEQLEALRHSDRVLVMVRGRRWIEYAEFFALNSPWLDSPIVAAHDVHPSITEHVLSLYTDREVWYYAYSVFTPRPFPYEEPEATTLDRTTGAAFSTASTSLSWPK